MTRTDALLALMTNAMANRNTVTSYRRIIRAAKVLGLDHEERAAVLNFLEYTNASGALHKWLADELDREASKSGAAHD